MCITGNEVKEGKTCQVEAFGGKTSGMEFVGAGTPEQALLLTLIRKLDDNTQAVNELQKLFVESRSRPNALSDFRPPDRMSPEQEARWLRDFLTEKLNRGQTRLLIQNIGIHHDVNVKHLRDNGFSVDPDPLVPAPRTFVVRWEWRTRGEGGDGGSMDVTRA